MQRWEDRFEKKTDFYLSQRLQQQKIARNFGFISGHVTRGNKLCACRNKLQDNLQGKLVARRCITQRLETRDNRHKKAMIAVSQWPPKTLLGFKTQSFPTVSLSSLSVRALSSSKPVTKRDNTNNKATCSWTKLWSTWHKRSRLVAGYLLRSHETQLPTLCYRNATSTEKDKDLGVWCST